MGHLPQLGQDAGDICFPQDVTALHFPSFLTWRLTCWELCVWRVLYRL
jgi:hypothetical protein